MNCDFDMWPWVAQLPRLIRRPRAERGETSSMQLLEVAVTIKDISPCATIPIYNGDNGFLLSVYLSFAMRLVHFIPKIR
jgi:hypothetical protein